MKKIIKTIDQYNYISFDIFDTLIKRNVAKPSDVFSLMEKSKLVQGINGSFIQDRCAAEKDALHRKKRPVSLKEIYAELEYYGYKNSDNIMNLEMETELEICLPHIEYSRILRYCVENNKTVVLISDMYLPSQLIKQILRKCGIKGYYKVYVSCEYGASKANGMLFRIVLNELGISPKEILHIGDNKRSDILRPRFIGIHTIHVPCHSKKICKKANKVEEDRLIYRTLIAGIDNTASALDLIGKMGCETLGPILLGFTLWLINNIQEDGIKSVYFMSRDGYLMKEAFDILKPASIDTHYLYCSRRSYTVPLIWRNPNYEDLFKTITIPRRITLRGFIVRIGLKPEKYCHVIKEAGLTLDYVYENNELYYSENVRKFYQNVQEDVISNSRNEYEGLVQYISETGMEGKVAVVDIGRHGTMQYALQQLVENEGINISLVGYYIGVSRNAQLVNSGKIEAKGYLYQRYENENIEDETIKFVSIFESIFLAQHGSVERFSYDNGSVKVEKYPYEYELEEGKRIEEEKIIKNYQRGALSLVYTLGDFFIRHSLQVPPKVAFYAMHRMGTAPRLNEARLWGDFRVFDMVTNYIAWPGSKYEIICKPLEFKRRFMKSSWKIGFMRRTLKLPLPYHRIYNSLQKSYNKR